MKPRSPAVALAALLGGLLPSPATLALALAQSSSPPADSVLLRAEPDEHAAGLYKEQMQVCVLPCLTRVAPGPHYQIVGAHIMPVRAFTIPAAGAGMQLHLRVHEVSQRSHSARIGLAVVSPLLIVSGFAPLAIAASPTSTSCAGSGFLNTSCHPLTPSERLTENVIGGMLIGVGVVGLATGIYLIATSRSTVRITTERAFGVRFP